MMAFRRALYQVFLGVELSTADRAAFGQRQYGLSVWGDFCFEFFDGDIDFDRRDMFLHSLIPTSVNERSQTPSN
jgi:hypothetical protein